MPRQNKYQNVVVLSDSGDDDDTGGLLVIQVSEDEEVEDFSSSSDDQDVSEASSFHPSDESEPSQSGDEYEDDCDYQQSEDDHRDDEASGSSPSDGVKPGDGEDDKPGDDEDDDSLSKRVVQLLQEKRDIGNLKLNVYKAYLRKHGLRLSGTKAECLMRIHEHWRIKDGKGEALYRRSSFSINCTGDVCKGDVVLFTQRVYQKFEKVKRSGKVLGSRTIAGRVVKESYGAAKQQHTFTVEVLWSKGAKALPSLFPLLIKGRNLYRLKTCRQPWMNEAERSKALDEKHQRGAMARQKRDVRIQERNRHKGRQTSDRGERNQKHHTVSNHTRDGQRIHSERGKHGNQRGKGSSSANQVTNFCHKKGQYTDKGTINKETGARTFNPAIAQSASTESYPDLPHERFRGLQVQSDHRNEQNAFPRGHVPSSSAFMGPSVTSDAATGARKFNPTITHHKPTYARHKASTSVPYPGPPYQRLQVQSDHRNAQNAFPRGQVPSSAFMGPSAVGYYESHHQAPASYAYRSERVPPAMPYPAFHSGRYMHQNQGFFSCSTRGCKNSGSEGCAISGCWHCCRRAGMRCHVHK